MQENVVHSTLCHYLLRLDGRVHCFPVLLRGRNPYPSFSGEGWYSQLGEFLIGRNMFDGELRSEGDGGVELEDMLSFSVDELRLIELLTCVK